MDALLGLGLGGDARGNQLCESVDDLKNHIQTIISTKCTEKRVEHISNAFHFQRHTAFVLTAHVEEGQDPVTQLQHVGVTRTVTTAEAINRQPSDDPALQKDIAKHIVAQISAVDGTLWVVREVGRSSQGWTFTYICKDSMQAWTRATAKTSSKHLIGEWTGPGGLDDYNAVRPAFDCRGTLSIAFSKSRRAIVVKYEHSPLHKTVSQLMDILAPAPAPPVPQVKEKSSNANKTPRPKKSRRSEVAAGADGAESTESTTQKTKKRPAPAVGEDGTPAKKKKPRKSKGALAAEVAAEDAANTTTEAVASADTEGTANAQASSASTTNFSPLNVPPAEAERRKEAAVRLLSGRGIDPTTLTTEQLNIFANQAPQLQETSLQMFALYGAERLRIVHPNDAIDETSASPAPAAASSVPIDPNLGGDNTATEDAGHTAQVSIGAGAVVDVEENGAVGTTSTTLQPSGVQKTRGACDACKKKKAKCPKERPECSNCAKSGLPCIYAPVKPRRKSEKVASEAEAVSDQEDEGDATLNHASGPVADNSINYNNVDPPKQTSQTDYFSEQTAQSQQDRLSFNQTGYGQQPQPQYTTALDAVQQALNNPDHTVNTSASRTTTQHEGATQNISPVTQASAEPYKRPNDRRSLPNGRADQQTPVQPPRVPAQQPAPRPAMPANVNMTSSPTMLAHQIGHRPRSKKPAGTANQMSPKVAQASVYTQPTTQAQASHSPYQTGHVAPAQTTRTHVSVPDVYSGAQSMSPAPSQSTTANVGYSGTASNAAASSQEYGRYGNTRTDRYSTTARTSPLTTTSTMTTTNPATTSASGLSLPSYSTQADPCQRPGSVANTAAAAQSAASRRKPSQSSSQWTAHNGPSASGSTAYANNFNLPSTHSPSSHALDKSVSGTNSTSNNNVYNSSQPSYSNYSSQQMSGTSNNQTQQQQQNWYGNNSATSFATGNRTAAYPTTAASNNSDHMSTYQDGSNRNSSVNGYGGHVYDMAGDGNMYHLFQGNRQH